MLGELLGYAVFLRHGQTEYTDKFPDLTPEGIETIERSSSLIKTIIDSLGNQCGPLAITCSEAPRACGSASIIAKELKYEVTPIQSSLLNPAKVLDTIVGLEMYNRYMRNGGMRSLCVAFSTDPRFEEGGFMEPRSACKKRFFSYLGMLVRNLIASGNHSFVVSVSHYETLCHLVEQIFMLDYELDEPLWHGEIIQISIYEWVRDFVEMKITFRNRTAGRILFNHRTNHILTGPA
ncbi:MAG TPA: hypothetical protein PKZ12_02905 [Smithellaceae bacterium]|nr:hypothetical protein [Smithellaceae bacterium]